MLITALMRVGALPKAVSTDVRTTRPASGVVRSTVCSRASTRPGLTERMKECDARNRRECDRRHGAVPSVTPRHGRE